MTAHSGRGQPLFREVGPLRYEAKPSAFFQPNPSGKGERAAKPRHVTVETLSETPLGSRKVAQGQVHTQAETKLTPLTLYIGHLEACDLALGRGSPPFCTEAHTQPRKLSRVKPRRLFLQGYLAHKKQPPPPAAIGP